MSIYRCSDFLLFCNSKNTKIKSFLYRRQIQLVKLVRDESLHFSPEKCRLSSRTKWYEQYYSISVENGPKTTYGDWSYVPGSTFRCRLFPEKPVLVQTFVYYCRVADDSLHLSVDYRRSVRRTSRGSELSRVRFLFLSKIKILTTRFSK